MSTNPGATTAPSASRTRSAVPSTVPTAAVRGGGGAVSASIRRRRAGCLDRPPPAAPHRRCDGAPASPLRYSARARTARLSSGRGDQAGDGLSSLHLPRRDEGARRVGPPLRRLEPAPAAGVRSRCGLARRPRTVNPRSVTAQHGSGGAVGAPMRRPNGSVASGPVSSGAESKRRRCPRSRAVTLLGGRGVAPRGGLQHAPRAHAAGTDEKPPPAAAQRDVHLLEVRPPEPLRLVVGVAHVVADGALFAADVARARHGAGCVARGRGACNVRACGEAAGAASALPLGRRRPSRALTERAALGALEGRGDAAPAASPVRAATTPGCGG